MTGNSWNEVDSSGSAPWWWDLALFLLAARNHGLTPIVALNVGNGVNDPKWPNANSQYGIFGPGDYQYECGLYGLSTLMKQEGVPVTHWEVYNEPDSPQPTVIPSNVAANYFTDAYFMDHAQMGLSDFLVAGSFNFSSVDNSCCSYIHNYATSLHNDLAHWGYYAPDAISGHPYNDPTFSGACNCTYSYGSANLVNAVDTRFPGEPIWLTEAGVWLNDPTLVGAGLTYGWYDDGNALDQAWGAQGFKSLADSSSQIKAVFWYDFEAIGDGSNSGSDSWDSALLGISNASWDHSGLYDPANMEYGVPRPSLCVLAYGDSPSSAVTDSRCDFPTTGQNPLTDWQDPHGG